MAHMSQIFLFGDQTSGFDAGLRQLLHVNDSASLTAFFERAHFALRQEIGHLNASQRNLFPRFTSILDLLAKYSEACDNPALESALTCIHHLAIFIRLHDNGGRAYPLPSNSHLIGSCTGLLAAAAVSCCRTVGELLPVAVEAVLVAFRCGLCAFEAAERLEPRGEAPASWSALIPQVRDNDVRNAIDKFTHDKALPSSSHPYISAIAPNSITLSGPPRVLEQFLSSDLLVKSRSVRVPVHAPYHAAHLYTDSDVEQILTDIPAEHTIRCIPRIPLLSASKGEVNHKSDLRSLYRSVIAEMLVEPGRWDRILQNCTSLVESGLASQWTIVPVATNAAQSLLTSVQQTTGVTMKIYNALTDSESPSGSCPTNNKSGHSKIAIIGYSGRFPDAASSELFWDLLYKGLDVHREVPKDRFDAQAHCDPTGRRKNTSRVINGCWIEEPGLFDARFFNMSPREAASADPGQRLAIVTAHEALEMAGFIPDRTPSSQRDRVGLFYGMTSDDYREVNSGQNIDTYFIPGGNRAFTPGRINYHFKFSGPSFSVDTACSSSLSAIQLACNSLWNGNCDTALAGGTNVMTNPDNFAGLDRGHFLTTKGNCNTFDNEADGYCRADGVGTVVLKRLEDAEADNDPIQGIILSASTNHSAEAVSMTRPHSGAQATLFRRLLDENDISPHEISYVEMHGTGTQAGDGVEMKSVLDVFAPDHTRKAEQSLHIGSAKANVGHAESASGVTALVKTLLMMQKNLVPPHPGIKTKINTAFPLDLQQRNVHIAKKPTPWNRPEGGKRRAFVNNFSAAGGNTTLLLEDGPVSSATNDQDCRSMHLVAISAKSKLSLRNNIASLIKYVKETLKNGHGNSSLAKLSYTTTARRAHYPFRVMVSGADTQQVTQKFEALLDRDDVVQLKAPLPNIVMAFTGQGAQYTAMGQGLFANFSKFRTDIRQLDHIGQSLGFPSIQPLIDGTVDFDQLSPVVVQLGTTCMQMALARLWSSWGIEPSMVIGHSLGEYAALNVAGVLTASDTIYLAGTRAQLLVDRCTKGTNVMLAVNTDIVSTRKYLNGTAAEVACINGPDQTVISGTTLTIETIANELKVHGIKSTTVKVPYAFHSAQVEPILTSFEKVAAAVTFYKPKMPIISPLLTDVITDTNSGVLGPAYLRRHCREVVNFHGALEAAQSTKFVSEKTIWIEIGCQPICCGMIKSSFKNEVITLPSLRRNEDVWKTLSGTLSSLYHAGFDLKWDEYHRDFKASHEVLRLPLYSWDNKTHWIQYVHDWSLTKGNAPTALLSAPPVTPAPVKTKRLTAAVQNILEEQNDDLTATVLMESDLSDPDLRRVIEGHEVNGAALCPSSLYSDIAETLCDHLISQFRPDMKELGFNVADMVVDKPLIFNGSGKQRLRVSATADWVRKFTEVRYYSTTETGKKVADHAKCKVYFEDVSIWQKDWQRVKYMVTRSIKTLNEGVDNGSSDKVKRGMAYKLFGALVNYHNNYKGMAEVVFNGCEHEGTAQVKFQAPPGDFYRNPFWIDSLGHLTGFIMNASDGIDSKTQVFVNHGWDSTRISKKYSQDSTYQTYVKMQPVGGGMYAGDLYVFEADEIIAVYGGVKFQGIPRQILNKLLPPAGVAKAAPSPIPKPLPVPTANAKPMKSSVPYKAPPVAAPRASVKTPIQPSFVTQALSVVAAETGIELSELTDDTAFADLGVDSLLSLTVAGELREKFGLEIESSVFTDCPTVKDLKQFLGQSTVPAAIVEKDLVVIEVEDLVSSDASTFEDSSSSFSDDESATSLESSEDGDTTRALRQIIAEEIGLKIEEITDDTDLTELGMDSLLSITILGSLREKCDMEISEDLLVECHTVSAIAIALGITERPKPQALTSIRTMTAPASTPKMNNSPSVRVSPATSILLQGNPNAASKTLFLFPDGSGSSTSYGRIPAVGPDVCVFGLNCPFMKNPQDFTCSILDVTFSYVSEIRRRQPHGPYNFGGWSAGGVIAMDAAQQLISQGETVDRLILIDSPFPIGLQKLPPRLYHFFDSIGMFGNDPPPKWLLPHFMAFVDALDKYAAVPFQTGKAPKTHLIWARDGVCKSGDSPRPEQLKSDPKEMWWLLNNRSDFGPNKWDTLVGGKENMVIKTMDNANHFTLMEGEQAKKLSLFIREAMMA